MTELVPRSKIEKIVGHPRCQYAHLGRFVTEENKVYIISSDYIGLNMKRWAETNRPDLEWIGYNEETIYDEDQED